MSSSSPFSSLSQFMAISNAPRRTLDSYAIKGNPNKIVRDGDCVLMRPADPSQLPYIARVEKIASDSNGENISVLVRWYYRPEESIGGRRQFHGGKEVFLSDHFDEQSADTIEGKCTVHCFKSYTELDVVVDNDFFCRFEYNSITGAFNPDSVAVYCKCEMPYNPDELMVQCEGCKDWFHPPCIDMDIEDAKIVEHFSCETCAPQDDNESHNNTASSSRNSDSDTEVDNKRRRR